MDAGIGAALVAMLGITVRLVLAPRGRQQSFRRQSTIGGSAAAAVSSDSGYNKVSGPIV
jgi:hypothetical protein